jgi:hypothetical protein
MTHPFLKPTQHDFMTGHQSNSKHDGEQNSRLAVAMVAARLLMTIG